MGFVGTARLRHLCLTSWLAVGGAATGCAEVSDPVMPCVELDLGDAEPSAMVNAHTAPVLAMAGGDHHFVLHYICPELASSRDDCILKRTPLPGLAGGNAVLVTAAGNYVVATDHDSRTLLRYHIDAQDGIQPRAPVNIGDNTPVRLVASLRNSDWVITRDLDGNLQRFHPGQEVPAQRVAPDHDDMMLAALGERHIVGRVVLDGGREELYLIPIDGELSYLHRDPIRLGAEAGPIASRIAVTPRDEYVAVTYGEGDSAYTNVFRAPDGQLAHRFTGALVSGRQALTELPGLRAVSPDGSQLAYRTQKGSVAMRDLETGGSCLIQSATAEKTRVAGFAANGVLFYEMDGGPGRASVKAWVPHEGKRWELSTSDEGYMLASVPARSIGEEDTPWAIGMNQGTLAALQEARPPEAVGLDEAVFVARDDNLLWAINTYADADTVGKSGRRVQVRRVAPRWSAQLRALSFDTPDEARFVDTIPGDGSVPEREADDEIYAAKPLNLAFNGPERVCLSTGTPGSWAYSCGSASGRTFLALPTTPASEDPFGNPSPEPEIPATDDSWKCPGDGVPFHEATNFFCYEVDGCCYRSADTACSLLNCDDTCFPKAKGDRHETLACVVPGSRGE